MTKTFIVNLTTIPLTVSQIGDIKDGPLNTNVISFVDEVLNLNAQTVSSLADTWKVLSTHPTMSDQCDHVIFIMPLNICSLSLVQNITMIAEECRAQGTKWFLPTYVVLNEDGSMSHLN